MTIWEKYGITLEEYAKAFNEALEGKMYFLDTHGEEIRVCRIINIKPPEKAIA